MTIIGTRTRTSSRTAMDDTQMTLLSACMAAMLEGIAALELEGVLADGFFATATPVAPGRAGSHNVVVTVTGGRPRGLAGPG